MEQTLVLSLVVDVGRDIDATRADGKEAVGTQPNLTHLFSFPQSLLTRKSLASSPWNHHSSLAPMKLNSEALPEGGDLSLSPFLSLLAFLKRCLSGGPDT